MVGTLVPKLVRALVRTLVGWYTRTYTRRYTRRYTRGYTSLPGGLSRRVLEREVDGRATRASQRVAPVLQLFAPLIEREPGVGGVDLNTLQIRRLKPHTFWLV